MRYSRALSVEFAGLLSPEGPLGQLLPTIIEAGQDDPYTLDIQFRGPDLIPVYHGWQALVWIEHRPEINAILLNFNRNYRDQPESISITEADRAVDVLSEFLPDAIERCRPAFYGDHAEGYWQNRLSVSLGRGAASNHSWLVVDRNASMDASKEERNSIIEPIRRKYEAIRSRLQREAPEIWGKPAPVAMRHECDLLGIGPSGELLCIEVKHDADARGFHWGLLEAAIAAEVFRQEPASAVNGVRSLVQQKVSLGLLPPNSVDRLRFSGAPKVIPVLVVADTANDEASSWTRSAELRQFEEVIDVELAKVTSDGQIMPIGNAAASS